MIYGNAQDYSESEMLENLKTGGTGARLICDVHRDIYNIVHEVNISDEKRKRLVKLLVECHRMAKKMSNKLVWYKSQK